MNVDDCNYCQGTGWVDCDAPWCTDEGHGAPCWCQDRRPVVPPEHHWRITTNTWAGYRERARRALGGGR